MPQTGGREVHARVLNEVIKSLQNALSKLDRINAPADVGAHIDHAVCRLRVISGQ